jgi:uncharacterized phage infection (PIP) family protein YhgE
VHIVTKILVFAAAVLSLVLAALTISYSVNADRVVRGYTSERNLKLTAEASQKAAELQLAEETARLQSSISDQNKTLTNLQGQLAQLQTENARLNNDLKTAQVSQSSFENKIAQLGETTKTQQDLITSYRNEVTKLREDELGFRKREIELVDRINDLESNRETLEQATRALQEQLAEARLAMNAGKDGGKTSMAAGPSSLQGPVVRGRVVKTMKDEASGDLLAQIDLGSNDQMRDNLKLSIARGDKWLGELVLIKTDLRWSVGRVKLQQGEIKDGDIVLSSLR